MKKILFFVLISFVVFSCNETIENSPAVYFGLNEVRLLDSEFKKAQEVDRKYLLTLDADRLLAPFHREAGLTPKAESYPNWENTGLDGHIGGHYLSGLSLMYAATGDNQIKGRLDYMIAELKKCQEANGDGYIGGVPGGKAIWNEIRNGNIRAGAFSLNEKWVPLYNIHKTYAGLRDAWLYAHSEDAKEMLIKMADWAIQLVSKLSDEQVQEMLRSEHGGLNETFADVASITGGEKYLELAHRFSQMEILQPLIHRVDELTGKHANTQIPKVIGYQRVAELNGDTAWLNASRFFWDEVVNKRSVAIGGNSVREHFHPIDDFSSMLQYVEGPETCNTYNMLKLTKMLYRTNGNNSKYVDYYEKALYNHILASIHPANGGLVYFTPMRPNHYRVYSQPQTSFWCCVGSGIENPGKYSEMIYAHTEKSLYVNLFIPSELNWEDKDMKVTMNTAFPDDEKVLLTFNPVETVTFSLKVRYPSWVDKGDLKMQLNGQSTSFQLTPNGYAVLSRKWNPGDKLEIDLPAKIAVEQLADSSNNFAFRYGPVVLAAEAGTDNLDGLYADDSRMGHVALGAMVPLEERQFIIAAEKELAGKVTREAGDQLAFRLSGVYSGDYDQTFKLVPFFRIHDSRYNIYWSQASKDELKEIIAGLEKEEQERILLDSKTVDKVECGEQQPESDHFIRFEESWIGYWNDFHYREARKRFSYILKNKNKQSRFLYLKYFDRESDRSYRVSVNGVFVTSKELEGKSGDSPVDTFIPIPEKEADKKQLKVDISSLNKQITMQLIEVRILSERIEY